MTDKEISQSEPPDHKIDFVETVSKDQTKDDWEDLLIDIDPIPIKESNNGNILNNVKAQNESPTQNSKILEERVESKPSEIKEEDMVIKSNDMSSSDHEDLIRQLEKLEIKDDKDKILIDETQPIKKEKIRVGRGFNRSSESVLNKSQKDISSEVIEQSTPKLKEKSNTNQPKRGERNVTVASRMLRNALGIQSPLSEKEKRDEKRLKELKEEKLKQQSKNHENSDELETKK